MFDVSKVSAVYSGRKGCACGCRGKYTYASAFKAERPSYVDPDSNDGVNDRVVRAMVAKVESFVRDGSNVEGVMVDAEWFAVDMENDRTYTVYFRGGVS